MLRTAMTILGGAWEGMKDIFSILKPCRFSVATLVVVSAFLIWVPQGQEALRGLGEGASYLRRAYFTAFGLLWALLTWYSARTMLRIRFHDTPEDSPRIIRLRKWVPRILGTSAVMMLFIAQERSAAAYETINPEAASTIVRMAWIQFAAGAALFVVLWKRRRIFNLTEVENERLVTRFGEVEKHNKNLIFLIIAMTGLAFIAFTITPVRAASNIGPASILLLAASAWVSLGSVLVYWGSRHQIPVITAMLLAAIVFSMWNDNHELRWLDTTQWANERDTVQVRAEKWLSARKETIKNSKQYPIFIVAAEGGGIRAAYWTSSVLTALQDKYPEFAEHTFAISGVSGGSLGAAVFELLVQEQKDGNNFEKCGEERTLYGCSRSILERDFMSPTLASMLYPDLVQRVLPFSVAYFDRAKTLEYAWESSWQKSIGNDRLARGFNEIWKADSNVSLPSLFLNSTSVESGKRFIFSNLAIDGKDGSGPEFADSYDAQAIIKKEIPFSTAIHGSARFTYVSPAGTIRDDDKKEIWGHIVDGGYFENSGAATASEVMDVVLKVVGRDEELKKHVVPVVVMISNEPEEEKLEREKLPPTKLMNEALSPVRALLNTRVARGSYSQDAIKRTVGEERYLLARLKKRKVPLPLGWMLSKSAREEIHNQIVEQMNGRAGIGAKVGQYFESR